MNSEVRWIIQTCRPGSEDWRDTDETYAGWFFGGAMDKPSTALLRDFEEAKNKYKGWLDVRLIQEWRTFDRITVEASMVPMEKTKEE